MQSSQSNSQSTSQSILKPHRLPDLELVGYLHRWCIVPRSKSKNQYLHQILSADEPILHDHPWDFKSMILTGSYIETTPEGEFTRRAGDMYEKKATDLHYIKSVEENTWTMVFTGPNVRDWGFQIEGEWVSHDQYEGRRLESIFRNGYSDDSAGEICES